MRILIAGVGNVLRGDDGFGVALARRLHGSDRLPPGVRVVETGIAGISLVHELQQGYDALIALDAIDRQSEPGTLFVLEPQVPEIAALSARERRDFLADMHWSDPTRTLMLAKALGILPARVLLVGCQPRACDDLCLTLSPCVNGALDRAYTTVVQTVAAWRSA